MATEVEEAMTELLGVGMKVEETAMDEELGVRLGRRENDEEAMTEEEGIAEETITEEEGVAEGEGVAEEVVVAEATAARKEIAANLYCIVKFLERFTGEAS